MKRRVLVVASYPPRACGIATYSRDLINGLKRMFSRSFEFKVCALQVGSRRLKYGKEVVYTLDTTNKSAYTDLALQINEDDSIDSIFIQHEFGLYSGEHGSNLLLFLYTLTKSVSITFHTVLPNPSPFFRTTVKAITSAVEKIIVMTHNSAHLLTHTYGVNKNKIEVIPHGTHAPHHNNREKLKFKYKLEGKKVLSTFGLLNPGKSIETAVDALPEIIEEFPNTVYLILGRTHPEVIKRDGEQYRIGLKNRIRELGINDHVIFVNKYLELNELLEYLQLTDIYLFTSKDPLQAVSGTFSYALSCGCPIISTPIPHAKEVLTDDVGLLVGYGKSAELASAVVELLDDPPLMDRMRANAFQKMLPTTWENTAIAHSKVLLSMEERKKSIQYTLPQVSLKHLSRMTVDRGIIQFSKFSQPDITSGFTLDDNARALIASCMFYNMNGSNDSSTLKLMRTYMNFIRHCQQPSGKFMNYVDRKGDYHVMNHYTNLEDSNGRAIWALGYYYENEWNSDEMLAAKARTAIQHSILWINSLQSPRAMAFVIKGLHHFNKVENRISNTETIKYLAEKLVRLFDDHNEDGWLWYEPYLTYANAVLPEALLLAYLETGERRFLKIAKASFDFLLSMTFVNGQIKVISNRGWKHKGQPQQSFGEQPIDAAYTILALDNFYELTKNTVYREKIDTAMSWFYGNNHLEQVIYNHATGGCFDGLEETKVNLNQGAESIACYLMARITAEKYVHEKEEAILPFMEQAPVGNHKYQMQDFRKTLPILRSQINIH